MLVASCDAYSDLWRPFFELRRRHWPDCPFPIYLGAGSLDCGEAGVRTLHSTAGKNWSACMIDYLRLIATPYVLIMLDDFFLRRPVRTDQILYCLNFAQRTDAVQVRLIPRPGPSNRLPGEKLIGECVAGLPYRLDMQAAIWDRLSLSKLLTPGESIWEFEHKGNERALDIPHGLYSVWRSALPYDGILAHHVVEKGLWLVHEKWIFGQKNLGCDFSRRGTLPPFQTLLYHAAQLLDLLLSVLPWKIKLTVKKRIKFLIGIFAPREIRRMSGQ